MSFRRVFRQATSSEKPFEVETSSIATSTTGYPTKPTIPMLAPSSKESSFGTNPVIKTLYEDRKKGWVESPPKQISSKTAKTLDRVAIKVYKKTDETKPTINGRAPLMTETIEIQSPVLVAAMKPILEPLGTFLEANSTAKFTRPFKPLFFAYEEIVTLQGHSREIVFREHLNLLCQLLIDEFGAMMTRLRNLRASNLICFDLAWTYFPRGSIIYCGEGDCERLYRVLDTSIDQDTKSLKVSCQDIAFNGTKFDWNITELEVPHFEDNVPITSLPNYPLAFHPKPEALKARMVARAKVVLNYQDLQYREYTGTGKSDDICRPRHNVSGRILIDYHGYQKHHKGLTRQSSQSNDGSSSYIKPLGEEKQSRNKAKMLAKPQDLIFVSPMLAGFALKNKMWLHFYVDDIRPVSWNDEAYSHLVYPAEQKDLVLTFVSNHQHMKAGLTDVIVGKGQGLVTLLSGPPGTGKTLLAEAVADKTRRPLYYLQAEELGTNATLLGQNVKKVFAMATEWNAVILLDEADVFMAERSPSDVLRNELVSIFLRELEYYQGIIFLTTNLMSTIDNAFRSRVNIHLIFSPLSVASRVTLWGKLLSRSSIEGSASDMRGFGEKDIEQLALWGLNGREIKNAIKTVKTWCECKGVGVTLERMESGIKVTSPQVRKGEMLIQG